MDQKTYAHQLVERFDTWKTFKGLTVFVAFVASWFALSVAVFIRKDFGERFLGWVNLWFAYTALANFAFFGNLISGYWGHGHSWLISVVWFAFLAASAWHRFAIWARNRSGVQWHSYYAGRSLLPFRCSDELMLTWIEPGFVLVLSMVLSPFSPLVSTWLWLAAVSLWVHAQITIYYQKQGVLDAIDAGLEARFLSDAVSGKPAGETGGVTIAESVRRRVQESPDVVVLMGGLAPELRDMVTPRREP